MKSHVHRRAEEQRALLARLRRDADALAREFGLALRGLDAESPRVRRRFGVCYSDGSIRIRLRSARTGRALRYSALIDTLCHELAHLRHFDHSPRFHALRERIRARARELGMHRLTSASRIAAALRRALAGALPVRRVLAGLARLRRGRGLVARRGMRASEPEISRRAPLQLSLFDSAAGRESRREPENARATGRSPQAATVGERKHWRATQTARE